jgi:simple sugar transport system ATP-binding protein
LREADFSVRGGEIHALLGANGAGKSTLMKILSGAYTPDGGSILLDGKPLAIRTPADAKARGIQCVYQEVDTALVPELSVAENIWLDRMASGAGRRWLRWSKICAEAEAVLRQLDARIPVRRKISELTLSEKQLVLIARCLAEQAKFIIFDEPTAPLSLEEAEHLFKVMERLKRSGVGCIFISHRLPEIFRMCDRITVMRDGRRVLSAGREETSERDVVFHMLGKTFEQEFPKLEADRGELLLEVNGLGDGGKVRDATFRLHRGEIVGIVGVVGAGKTELSRLLFGADPAARGTVRLRGQGVKFREPADAVKAGIVLVPEERRKQGILVAEPVRVNLGLAILGKLSRFGFLRRGAEAVNAREAVERLGIKTASIQQPAGLLSGGNQQKVAIGKWLSTDADIFLFDEPTKGVDIGAKSDIFRIIGQLARQGKGIVYLSCEFSEIMGIADRIYVMCDGRLIREFRRPEATEEQLLYYASAGQEALA